MKTIEEFTREFLAAGPKHWSEIEPAGRAATGMDAREFAMAWITRIEGKVAKLRGNLQELVSHEA